ncbi:MAG: VWA domain-containing protein [Acidobacteriota bacterium]|nr:VWA domain-containing protein [Acidobacteriota bacterium]
MHIIPTALALALCLAAATPRQQSQTTPPAPQTTPATQQSTPGPQLPAATPANTLTQNVRLVILDGVVVDKKGNAVTDLKRDEFHIAEDDQAQDIRNFEVPGRFTPSPDINIDSTADLDRLAPRAPVNIVLLDEFNTRFEDMAFARYSLKKWLEKQPVKLDTPTMLVAVDLQHFTVLRDYTENKDEIVKALDHHFAAYPWQAHQFAWVSARYTTAFLTLSRVAEATVGHLGHKNMIWLGRGFPTINLANVAIDGQNQIHSAVQHTVNELRDARVTLYTIDPAGLMIDASGYGSAAQLYSPFGGDPNFEDLARATGGRTLHGRNDVDADIGAAIRDGASLYTLTYRPTNSITDIEKFHRIKVTLDRPGLIFVTRQGYYPATRPARTTRDGQVGRRLANELITASDSNMAYDAIGFTAQASATDANDVKITVEPRGMSWYTVPDGSKPRFTRLIVISTFFDRKDKELKRGGGVYTFQAPASAPKAGRIDIPVVFKLKLEPVPKAVRARLVVRVEASGRMGTADLTLGPGASAKSSSALGVNTAPASPPTSTAPGK